MSFIDKQYFSVREVADRFGLSRQTLYRLIWDGEIKPFRIYRKMLFDEDTIQRFIQKRKDEAVDRKK